MEEKLYAIGDVHGHVRLLQKLHMRIVAYHRAYFPHDIARIIHIGDYIDGGPDSKDVIDLLMEDHQDFQSVCLLGNHEDMMLRCLETNDYSTWNTWLGNGGYATLKSFGIFSRFGGCEPSILHDALGQARIDWLKSLPLYYETLEYIFVHAGIVPEIPLERQSHQDLLWIRGRFLESNIDHGRLVIHGHTPTDHVIVKQNRIGIDTGVHSTGRLSGILLKQGQRPHVFEVE